MYFFAPLDCGRWLRACEHHFGPVVLLNHVVLEHMYAVLKMSSYAMLLFGNGWGGEVERERGREGGAACENAISEYQ